MESSWHYHPFATPIERSLDFATGQIVKENRQRTVTVIRNDHGEWYVKVCRLDGPRAMFRDLFRGAKAKLEVTHAAELATRGIKTIQPIAWRYSTLPGESAIVTRGEPNAIPLDEWFDKNSPLLTHVCHRRTIADELGILFRMMHDQGISHPDPHPGNLLICRGESIELTLLDLHAIRIGKPLSRAERIENLVLLNRWFALRATRSDRYRFLKAFARESFTSADIKTLAMEIESATLQSNLRFWQNRFGRYLGNNREYRKINLGHIRGMALKSTPPELVDYFLKNPDAVFDNITPIKTSKSSTVIRTTLFGVDCIIKRIPVRSSLAPIKNLLRWSTVKKSWMYGQSVYDRWLPTPRPLVMVHRDRQGLPAEGYLITEAIANSRTLHDWVQTRPSIQQLTNLAEELGRLLRTMHARGVAHRDLKSSNILIDMTDRAWLIDLVGVTTMKNVPETIRHRDLGRIAASFLDQPNVTNGLRLRLLKTYLHTNREWKTTWRSIATWVRDKVIQNQKRNRILA